MAKIPKTHKNVVFEKNYHQKFTFPIDEVTSLKPKSVSKIQK